MTCVDRDLRRRCRARRVGSSGSETVALAPRSYADRGPAGRRDRGPAAARRRRRGRARPDPRPPRRPDPRRRLRRRPGQLRGRAAPRDEGHLARARQLRAGAGAARDRARDAAARDLPRDADPQRRPRRHPRPAPARAGRPRAPPRRSRGPSATTRWRSRPAASPPRRRGRSGSGSNRTTTRGSTELGEGLEVTGRSVEDDLIEAIELPGRGFALGVIWHPEEDVEDRVIGALVEAARAEVHH